MQRPPSYYCDQCGKTILEINETEITAKPHYAFNLQNVSGYMQVVDEINGNGYMDNFVAKKSIWGVKHLCSDKCVETWIKSFKV